MIKARHLKTELLVGERGRADHPALLNCMHGNQKAQKRRGRERKEGVSRESGRPKRRQNEDHTQRQRGRETIYCGKVALPTE